MSSNKITMSAISVILIFIGGAFSQTPSSGSLTCAKCNETNEALCNANEIAEQCTAGQDMCFILRAVNFVTMTTTVIRGCLEGSLCDSSCSSLNASSGYAIQSCVTDCCNASLCNSGSPPIATTTPAPMTTQLPSTAPPTTPGSLTCAICNETSGALCNANEIREQCTSGHDRCFTLAASNSVTLLSTVIKGCLGRFLCSSICSSLNASSGYVIQACAGVCCNTSLCNSGNPLISTTTPAPMTTQLPSTASPTTPGSLTCATCNETNEALCNANEIAEQCTAGQDRCFALAVVNVATLASTVIKGCLGRFLCSSICSSLNASGTVQSCDSVCCNTRLCNSGSPLIATTTPAPMTPQLPSTASPTKPGYLICEQCDETSEALCNANAMQVQCTAPSDVCLSYSVFNAVTLTSTVVRNCFFSFLCNSICNTLNATSNYAIQSCSSICCNTSLCNSGSPPIATTTPAAFTTQLSSTASPTTPASASQSSQSTPTSMPDSSTPWGSQSSAPSVSESVTPSMSQSSAPSVSESVTPSMSQSSASSVSESMQLSVPPSIAPSGTQSTTMASSSIKSVDGPGEGPTGDAESDTDRKTILVLLSVAIAMVCLGIVIIIVAVICIFKRIKGEKNLTNKDTKTTTTLSLVVEK